MERHGGFSRRWLLFSISFLGLLLLVGEPNPSLLKRGGKSNGEERRKTKGLSRKEGPIF